MGRVPRPNTLTLFLRTASLGPVADDILEFSARRCPRATDECFGAGIARSGGCSLCRACREPIAAGGSACRRFFQIVELALNLRNADQLHALLVLEATKFF